MLAEIVFNKTLSLPGQYYNKNDIHPTTTFVQDLKTWMSKLQFTPMWITSRHVYIPKTHSESEYLFVHNDSIKKPLCPCYQVINRTKKFS